MFLYVNNWKYRIIWRATYYWHLIGTVKRKNWITCRCFSLLCMFCEYKIAFWQKRNRGEDTNSGNHGFGQMELSEWKRAPCTSWTDWWGKAPQGSCHRKMNTNTTISWVWGRADQNYKNISSLLLTDNWWNSMLPATDSSDQHVLKINKMVYFIYTLCSKKIYTVKISN